MTTNTQQTPYDEEIERKQRPYPEVTMDNKRNSLIDKREGYLRAKAEDADLLAAAEAINDMLYYQTTTNNGARIFTCCSCSANRSLEHSESCEVACFESAIAKAKGAA